ncbi:MAG: PEP-CTERM sorting domain-containing protein [Desulfobacteria bacterium]
MNFLPSWLTKKGAVCLFVLGIMSILPCASFAAPVIFVDDDRGNLGTVDVQTGAVTLIGNMGQVMTDIAFAPNGDLYGVTFTDLYKVNQTTGASTLIGSLGYFGENALVFGKDGTLYAGSDTSTNLYSVNTTTGAATVLGNIGYYSAGDLAFDSGGALYMSSKTNQLINIDTTSYVGTSVGPIGYSNVYGFAFGPDGVMYGVSGTSVFSIDLTTGAGSSPAVNYGGQGLGTAYGSSFYGESAPVPEPGTMVLLGSGLVGLVGYGRKKLKK